MESSFVIFQFKKILICTFQIKLLNLFNKTKCLQLCSKNNILFHVKLKYIIKYFYRLFNLIIKILMTNKYNQNLN